MLKYLLVIVLKFIFVLKLNNTAMKKLINTLFVCVLLLGIVSCKKEDLPTNDDNNNHSQLIYSKLSAKDTVMAVGIFTTLTATATGDELSYIWSADYGTFVGSGSSVDWSACHATDHVITCEVKDKYGASLTKTVTIHVN